MTRITADLERPRPRLFPLPERRDLTGFRFRRFEDGLAAVLEMFAIHLRPSMIDYEEDEP